MQESLHLALSCCTAGQVTTTGPEPPAHRCQAGGQDKALAPMPQQPEEQDQARPIFSLSQKARGHPGQGQARMSSKSKMGSQAELPCSSVFSKTLFRGLAVSTESSSLTRDS